MLESIKYFFKGQNLACFFIRYFPNVTICTASNFFNELIFVQNVCLNLICHMTIYNFEFQIFKRNVNQSYQIWNLFSIINKLNKLIIVKNNQKLRIIGPSGLQSKLIFKLQKQKVQKKNYRTQKMDNQSIQYKQQYLRQNIIDKGFDAEDFVQYCTDKHNLIELQQWSISKLKQVVQLYVNLQNQAKNSNQVLHEIDIDKQQWTNYQETSNQHNSANKQAQVPYNNTKNGNLVFSQADWEIFLGSTPNSNHLTSNNNSLPNSVKPSQQSKAISPNKKIQKEISDLKKPKDTPIKQQIKTQHKLQNQPQSFGKQNPLSPPSQNIKKDNMNLSSLIQQAGSKKQNKGPINFINIKLATSKVKQMPKLPQINDIVVRKTEQISRNFLQSDYTLYYIHFNPGTHSIQRKFSDFRKLRSILQNLYPHIRLPYLQPEGWLTSSEGKDTQTLGKYKWMVIDFLKYIIIRNQQLQNCPLVRKFCGYSTSPKSSKEYELISKQDLKKIFQAYENIPRPKNIGQLCLSNNFMILPPSNDGQKSLSNTASLLQQIDHQYEKLKKKFQTLFYNYQLLAKSMSDVSSSFQILQNLIKKYNFQNDEPKQFRIYEGFRQICNKMQNTMNQQYVIFKSRIKNILRYENDNMMTLKQLFDLRNRVHYEYSRQGYPTLSKNSQTGGELQIESNISLEQPCKNNKNTLCVQQIFWSYHVKQQINKYWQQLRKKINEQLTFISYEELDNQNDNLNFWNSMIKKCVV